MDTLFAYEIGFKAVGILGAGKFKDEWAYLFVNFQVIVIPDNDSAGKSNAESIERSFKNIGKEVRIIQLPPNAKDLDEYWRESK